MRTIACRSLSQRRLRPSATTICEAIERAYASLTVFGSTARFTIGIEELHGHARALLDACDERREVRAPAGDEDAADLLLAARREVEVERSLDLAREPLARLVDELRDLLRDDLRRPAAHLVGLRLLVRARRAPCGSPR